MSALAWSVLQWVIIRAQGSEGESALARALGEDIKGKISPVLYMLVALMWLVPDRRIERAVQRCGAPLNECTPSLTRPARV